jgi:hypothetical protein
VRTFTTLAVVLVACAFGLAIYAFQRPTVARGDVIAADLVAQNRANGWRAMTCDRDIPIGITGARFRCELELDDGDAATLAVTLDRDGRYDLRVVRETRPAHHHVPKSGDPWGE